MSSRVVSATALTVEHESVPAEQVVKGQPTTGAAVLAVGPFGECGVWEHTVGESTDVEVDEVFIVLSGRATITIADGPTLEVGPGDVGVLEAGSRTTWQVHEPLRKVYVTPTHVDEATH